MVFAKRSFGQNFLIDLSAVAKIVRLVDPNAGEPVLEIGPGRGALTEALLVSGCDLHAVEIDSEMIELLDSKFASAHNFHLHHLDILDASLSEIFPDRICKVVGNLPYNISTPILRKLIDERPFFSSAVLMVQREVAQRLTAVPSSSERGFMTVLVEAAFDVKRAFDVPPGSFRPAPKVWSSVIELHPKNDTTDIEKLTKIITRGFAKKRKTLKNNLAADHPNFSDAVNKLSIDPMRRPETLTLKEWVELADLLF